MVFLGNPRGINRCCLNCSWPYSFVNGYTTWEQVSGYFDGDGNISISDLSNLPYKLKLSLIFTDASPEQISMVREFLISKGIQTSSVLKTTSEAWMIAISSYSAVLLCLKEMLPYLYKKANEARGAIDYYEGRTSGNELVNLFKAEVDAKRRERRPRKVPIDVPYTIVEGERIMNEGRKAKFRDLFGRYRAKVTPDDYHALRRKHFEEGKRLADLAREYPQYARETIRRVLGGGRGYVGVTGVGRVDTTDDR